ncbi:MAG: DHH family phosphoesterase [Turicibacter sp.]|nr:DHH family phosphoesterase [Turicibacter sp.]
MKGLKKTTGEFKGYNLYGGILLLFTGLFGWYAVTEGNLVLWGLFLVFLLDLIYRIVDYRQKKKKHEEMVMGITHRVKRAGEQAFNNLPLGILLYNENQQIVWHNPFMKKVFIGDANHKTLAEISEHLSEEITANSEDFRIEVKEQVYQIQHFPKERLVYLTNGTEFSDLSQKYDEGRPVMGVLVMDNYDEAIRNLNEQEKNEFRAKIVSLIMQWAEKHRIFIRATSSERYLLAMSHKTLAKLRERKFAILDEVREAAKEREMAFTISIGLAAGYEDFSELGNRAYYMLDLALSRGGDQVAIKIAGDDKFLFYGGKTNPVEKRNRVRARVNAHAYERLVKDSDKVIIMGHKFPDVDAIGACIGLLRMVMATKKEGFIVLNQEAIDNTAKTFVAEIMKNESLSAHFVSGEVALSMITKNSMLVVADTQDPKMVIEPGLLGKTKKIAVFDHHRRGATYIESILSYTEPYASSTVELVVDMFDYYTQKIKMSSLEASIMLAGIIVDTRRFSYHTGRRTYETAAILKQKGAEEKLVQQLLRVPIENYYSKAHLTNRSEIYKDHFIIAASDEDFILEKVQLAQAADELLNVQNIQATFAVAKINENQIGISARSLGDLNVQVIMEQLGGGGHLNNAATQINDLNIAQVVVELKKTISKELEKSGD